MNTPIQNWKQVYRWMRDAKTKDERECWRYMAKLDRTAAAYQRSAEAAEASAAELEARIVTLEAERDAAQRTIEALQSQVWKLEAQEHNSDDGNEWEKEYYLRGLHR